MQTRVEKPPVQRTTLAVANVYRQERYRCADGGAVRQFGPGVAAQAIRGRRDWERLPPRVTVVPFMTIDELFDKVVEQRKSVPAEIRRGRKLGLRLPDPGEISNPIKPHVEAWQTKELRRTSRRPDPLFPEIVIAKHGRVSFSHTFRSLLQSPGQGSFPGFGLDDDKALEECPSLFTIFDLGGGPLNSRGRGAPISQRTFFSVVMAVPKEERAGLVSLPPMRFGEYLALLYPDGMRHYRARRHWGQFREAFEELDRVRIVWEDPTTGVGGATRIVWARTLPRDGRRNDWIVFGADFPPGAQDGGAIMDRAAMMLAGVTSGPAFRLAASLSFVWFRPGTLRAPIGRDGQWLQVRKPDRYPEASVKNLVRWTYPTGRRPQKAIRDARRALAFLVSIEFVAVADVAGVKRVLPGGRWAGWQ